MTDHVIAEIDNRVLTITFNRPDKKNALTHAMYAKAGDAIRAAADDKGVRAILITGAGDAFTSGNDLADFRDTPPIGQETPVSRFLEALVSCEKPIVAAVNGLAVGVGLTMLLHADIVYASEAALLSAPFVDLALVPEAASSLLLPARVGQARAAEIFMLGKRVAADEALAMGLVSAVFKAEELMPAAMKAAAMLAAKAPESLRQTKKLMRGDLDVVRTRMQAEGKLFGKQLMSAEVAEAITAFMQKRAPRFE